MLFFRRGGPFRCVGQDGGSSMHHVVSNDLGAAGGVFFPGKSLERGIERFVEGVRRK